MSGSRKVPGADLGKVPVDIFAVQQPHENALIAHDLNAYAVVSQPHPIESFIPLHLFEIAYITQVGGGFDLLDNLLHLAQERLVPQTFKSQAKQASKATFTLLLLKWL